MTKGFTLLEVIVVIAILAILSTIDISSYFLFQKTVDLNDTAQQMAETLRLAQSNTVSSNQNSQYGVYFDSTASPNKYVFFKGADYASKDPAYTKVFALPGEIEFSQINFTGNQTVFQKVNGSASNAGSVVLQMKSDASKTVTVNISSYGIISYGAPGTASESSLVKDYRHVTFDYNRIIANCPASGETLNLYFDGAALPQATIPICNFLSGSDMVWDESTPIGEDLQKIYIRITGLGTYSNHFYILRDGRYNNKSLVIKISGGDLGDLVNYSADGKSASHSSTNVQNFTQQ